MDTSKRIVLDIGGYCGLVEAVDKSILKTDGQLNKKNILNK
jgi:hypothetical protein